MAKSVLDLIFDPILNEIFDDAWKGRRGEKLTEKELKMVRFFGRDGKILRNVYIPKGNGQTSEIDVMYITEKGIFVFESKNYSGWIFGYESGQYWTVMLPNKQKNRFYNPIKQNRTHIKWLRSFVGDKIPLFSIIVFSERCELKKVTVESEDVKVIKRDYTYGTVRRIWNNAESVLTEDNVNELYEKLKPLTNVDEATKAAHIKNIEDRFKPSKPVKKDESTKTDSDSNKRICPRCGKELVLRTARRGEHAGTQFYGCSGFPGCRYTEKAEI